MSAFGYGQVGTTGWWIKMNLCGVVDAVDWRVDDIDHCHGTDDDDADGSG